MVVPLGPSRVCEALGQKRPNTVLSFFFFGDFFSELKILEICIRF
jgi:hypothetical protein